MPGYDYVCRKVPQEVFADHDHFRARPEAGQVPEVQEHAGRAGVALFFRRDFQEELKPA